MRGMMLKRDWEFPFWMLTLIVMFCYAESATATIESYEFNSVQQQAQFQHLAKELRCPKCQNQNIADSDAPIAKDLRAVLHQMVTEGQTDAHIIDFMKARYGEFVHYKPAFNAKTAVLWLAPWVIIMIGLVVIVGIIRSSTKKNNGQETVNDASLTEQERQQLDQLLNREKRMKNVRGQDD